MMTATKHQDDLRDDLSDAASSLADERTLNEEPLPTYDESSHSPNQLPHSEKTAPPAQNTPGSSENSRPQGPTMSNPFAFPSQEPPSYPGANAIQRPLAIPQIAPSAASPFILAYPTALLSFGVPEESWRSFVETLSAFLSAKVSQQAVHHAADIASSIGDFHKEYVLRTKEGFKNIGKSAKRFSPAGVIGGSIGITMGSVGHLVGTVFQAAGSLTQKPQTPRQRAAVYVATANKDWFHSRGLHAVLMDTSELSRLCEVDAREILSAAHNCGSASPGLQLAALQDIIGEVKVEQDFLSAALMQEASGSVNKAAGKRPVVSQFELGGSTLWLVLVQKQNVSHPSGKTPSGKQSDSYEA